MARIRIEHNLPDEELVSALEKALRGLKGVPQVGSKPMDDPFLEELSQAWRKAFDDQMEAMLQRIEEVIDAS